MLKYWEKDLREYQALIDEKKEASEPVGGMEINVGKGSQRYNEIVDFAEAAIAYSRAMEKIIRETSDRKAVTELTTLQKRIRAIEKRIHIPFHEW